MADLLPCPCCGSDEVRLRTTRRTLRDVELGSPHSELRDGGVRAEVVCPDCLYEGRSVGGFNQKAVEKAAVESWNERVEWALCREGTCQQTKNKAKLEAARAKLAARLADRKPKRRRPAREPRYDDVYAEGVEWLDSWGCVPCVEESE